MSDCLGRMVAGQEDSGVWGLQDVLGKNLSVAAALALCLTGCAGAEKTGNILPVFRRMRNWWCIVLIRLVLLIRL